jgi:hypothetical protein
MISASNILGTGGRVEYLLTLLDGKSREHTTIALPNVSMVQLDRQQAVQINYTLGRQPIIEHSGVRAQVFVLNGRSGVEHRLGEDASGQILFADGPALFRELEEFLSRFEQLQGEASLKRMGSSMTPKLSPGLTGYKVASGNNTASGGLMLFQAPFEKLNFHVQPLSFKWNRATATSRHSYEWTLVLHGYAKYVSAVPKGLLADFVKAMEEANKAINSATAMVAYAQAHVDLFSADLRSIMGPINAAHHLLSAVDGLLGSAKNLVQLPSEVLQELLGLIGHIGKTSFDLFNTMSFGAAGRHGGKGYFQFMRALSGAQRRLYNVFGQMYMIVDEDTSGAPKPVSSTAAGTVTPLATLRGALLNTTFEPTEMETTENAVVLDGMTLQDFADANNTDAVTVAQLNGMVNYTSGPKGVPLVGGMVLKVPAVGTASVKIGDHDSFGTDLKLDMNTRDLKLKGTSYTDFSTVSQEGNLVQGTALRLLTEQGEQSLFPTMGLPTTVGSKNTATVLGSMAFATESQLLADNRIQEVTGLEVLDEGDTLVLRVTASPVQGDPVDFKIPLQES